MINLLFLEPGLTNIAVFDSINKFYVFEKLLHSEFGSMNNIMYA